MLRIALLLDLKRHGSPVGSFFFLTTHQVRKCGHEQQLACASSQVKLTLSTQIPKPPHPSASKDELLLVLHTSTELYTRNRCPLFHPLEKIIPIPPSQISTTINL